MGMHRNLTQSSRSHVLSSCDSPASCVLTLLWGGETVNGRDVEIEGAVATLRRFAAYHSQDTSADFKATVLPGPE